MQPPDEEPADEVEEEADEPKPKPREPMVVRTGVPGQRPRRSLREEPSQTGEVQQR